MTNKPRIGPATYQRTRALSQQYQPPAYLPAPAPPCDTARQQHQAPVAAVQLRQTPSNWALYCTADFPVQSLAGTALDKLELGEDPPPPSSSSRTNPTAILILVSPLFRHSHAPPLANQPPSPMLAQATTEKAPLPQLRPAPLGTKFPGLLLTPHQASSKKRAAEWLQQGARPAGRQPREAQQPGPGSGQDQEQVGANTRQGQARQSRPGLGLLLLSPRSHIHPSPDLPFRSLPLVWFWFLSFATRFLIDNNDSDTSDTTLKRTDSHPGFDSRVGQRPSQGSVRLDGFYLPQSVSNLGRFLLEILSP
ncbi:hypothetical protein TgHK011_003696 [Trichoderma gracile]|nr:hypothetical protein TgHK011_003696 [Trichoderma gracile]